MADLTAAQVKERFTEFDSVDDAVVSALIADAYALTDVSEAATLNCVGHLLALHPEVNGKADGGSGEVTMEKIGPRQVQYMAQAERNREVFFTSTAYGRRCLSIEKRTPYRHRFGAVA